MIYLGNPLLYTVALQIVLKNVGFSSRCASFSYVHSHAADLFPMHSGFCQRSNNNLGWSAQLSWSLQHVLWLLESWTEQGGILRRFCYLLNRPSQRDALQTIGQKVSNKTNLLKLSWLESIVVLDALCNSCKIPFAYEFYLLVFLTRVLKSSAI